MKIILIEDVATLGRRGELRDVADGYARNYLLPQKLALAATPANMKNLDGIKAREDSRAAKNLTEARSLAQTIEALHLAVGRQASDEDRLFGSVGRADIAAFLTQHGLEVERRRIALDEPIKTLGEFNVPIRLHPDVTAQLTTTLGTAQLLASRAVTRKGEGSGLLKYQVPGSPTVFTSCVAAPGVQGPMPPPPPPPQAAASRAAPRPANRIEPTGAM